MISALKIAVSAENVRLAKFWCTTTFNYLANYNKISVQNKIFEHTLTCVSSDRGASNSNGSHNSSSRVETPTSYMEDEEDDDEEEDFDDDDDD